jgi:hypothetical protein
VATSSSGIEAYMTEDNHGAEQDSRQSARPKFFVPVVIAMIAGVALLFTLLMIAN